MGLVVLLVAVVAAPGLPAAAAPVPPVPLDMCPPTTMADLFPEEPEPAEAPQPDATPDTPAEEPATTTTTTVTGDSTTTTAPEGSTPTSAPDGTTTATAGEGTTTTEPAGPTTTVAPTTTTTTVPPPPPCSPFVYRMLFPVAGGGIPGSPFGADRDGGARRHEGVDIAVPKLVPVVAVADGTVDWVQRSAEGRAGVAVGIRHDDGWRSLYIHLNDDTYGSDDGQGSGVRAGLEEGDRVLAGQVVGWVGDSGNAENTSPHLHFELRMRNNVPIDPMASLRAALRRDHPVLGAGSEPLAGPYADAITDRMAYAFDLAVTIGLDLSCDDYGLNACPDEPGRGGEVLAWVAGLSGLDPGEIVLEYPPAPAPPDILSVPFEIPPSCGIHRFCPDLPVSRGEVAGMASSALGGPTNVVPAYQRLHDAGNLDICVPGRDAAAETVTRSGALVTLLRAFGYLPSPPCSALS